MKFSKRSMRRRRDTDQWEVRLLHKDPLTGAQVTTYHAVTAKTPKQAEKAVEEMISSMETKGYALYTSITVAEFMEAFLDLCQMLSVKTSKGKPSAAEVAAGFSITGLLDASAKTRERFPVEEIPVDQIF